MGRVGPVRITGGLLTIALVATLGACSASGGDEQGRAEFAVMLRVEQVPGVLLASYADYLQIDPFAPEDEIVETALAVREIVLELGDDATRKNELTIFASYPGDWIVNTEFTTRALDDAEKFERDIRTWASLLDEGFESVRYNVFDETGDGVLNINQRDPTEPTPAMSEVFDTMVGALGGPPGSYTGLQTEAWVGTMLATNRSATPELPAGWSAVLDAVQKMDFVDSSNASFELGTSDLALRGIGELAPDHFTEVMAVLTDNGVLLPNVTVSYKPGGRDAPVVLLYGVAK